MKVLSLGAGVQSTTLLLMAYEGEIERPDCAIFADTRWEPKAVYDHLYTLWWMVNDTIPIHRVTAGNIREDALNDSKRFASMPLHVANVAGRGGMIRRQCTREYKIEPIERKVRELSGYKPRQRIPQGTVEQWIGISLDEVVRMKPNQHAWVTNRWPLIEQRMTRHDCALWLERHGYPTPPKSACIGCPFHGNEEWRRIKSDPVMWADATSFDTAIRGGHVRVGKASLEGQAYLHRSLIPLVQVDLSTERDHGQLDMFQDECEGMCGV